MNECTKAQVWNKMMNTNECVHKRVVRKKYAIASASGSKRKKRTRKKEFESRNKKPKKRTNERTKEIAEPFSL